jgi:hypothetical protein
MDKSINKANGANIMETLLSPVNKVLFPIQDPVYRKVIINNGINETEDVLRHLQPEDLFTFICESDDDVNHLIDEPEWYVYSRTQLMIIFGYNTIPTIMQNIGNLNYNIRLYNEFVSKEDQTDIKVSIIPEFSIPELDAIVKYGVHMIQCFLFEKVGK